MTVAEPTSWRAILAGLFSGGLLVAIVYSIRDYALKSRPDATKAAELEAHRDDEEREVTERTMLEDRAERRQAHAENRELLEQLRKLSVQLAESEAARTRQAAEHAVEREAARVEIESLRGEVRSLRTSVDLQTQLIERQRRQVDDLVRRLMTGTENA